MLCLMKKKGINNLSKYNNLKEGKAIATRIRASVISNTVPCDANAKSFCIPSRSDRNPGATCTQCTKCSLWEDADKRDLEELKRTKEAGKSWVVYRILFWYV